MWECCFRGLFFKSCCICESNYLNQKFSSLGQFGCWTFGVRTRRNALWYDWKKRKDKNCQTTSDRSALNTLLPFFILLSVCPVQLVCHWCHSCALCHLKFGWSQTHRRHRVLMCVLEQNKMLQLHLSCFGFYIQTTKKRELFKPTTNINRLIDPTRISNCKNWSLYYVVFLLFQLFNRPHLR